jgi:hypothetical protein
VVLADSHGISRAPCYLGTPPRARCAFAYRAVTFCGSPFQEDSASTRVGDSPAAPVYRLVGPTTPARQRHRAITSCRFRLIPFRSPLLRESLLLFFPRGTEMFQFPRLPLPVLCVQTGVVGHYPDRVSPFGHPRINACLTAHRGFSQPATSFIGSQRQGIHRKPLVA